MLLPLRLTFKTAFQAGNGYTKLFSLLFTLLSLSSINANAQGNLLVMPRRILFEGPKRSDEINLANIGKDTSTYVLSLIHIRMKGDGTFEQINQPDSGQAFADKYLRFFPRTVTLGPNESQVIKVQLVHSNELLPGEYRSHLYFRAIPKKLPRGENEVVRDSGISVGIVPVFGISIPTIIRVGESSAKVAVADTHFQIVKDSIPEISFRFNRTGNMSVYGDVVVNHVSPEGKVTQVGMVKGLAVYTPNEFRNCRLVLDRNRQVNYHSGKLLIAYNEQGQGKRVTLTGTEIPLR